MAQVVILGASSLLGHHLIDLLAKSMVPVISFLPEDEAIFFMEKYPQSKLAFLPREPGTTEQVDAFMKNHPDVSHIVILGPHKAPTEAEFAAASKTLDLNIYIHDDPSLFAFNTASSRITDWLSHLSKRTIILQSSLWACDADDAMMDVKWKTFSHRDICIVTYKAAVESLESAERYTDAMVEHTFWSNARWVYPSGVKTSLPTAPLTGPGVMPNKQYTDLDFGNRKNMPLFIDVRDAALVYRNALFSTDKPRELVAQGPWNEQKFCKLAKENGLDIKPRDGKLEATCDTQKLQTSMGIRFKSFEESLKDTFQWLKRQEGT